MNHLLILSVLAALPLVEGLEITNMTACTTNTNDLSLKCQFKKVSGIVQYEWSLLKEMDPKIVISSTINPGKVDSKYKNRATPNMTDDMATLIVTGFGTADNGKYTCNLRLNNEHDNKTITVMKATIVKCGASGLLLNIPLMLSLLLLLPVLQTLGDVLWK